MKAGRNVMPVMLRLVKLTGTKQSNFCELDLILVLKVKQFPVKQFMKGTQATNLYGLVY